MINNGDILLTIKEMNWEYINYPVDDWVATTWEVGINGVVQIKIQKTLSGELYNGIGTISSESFNELKDELQCFEDKAVPVKGEKSKGTGYELILYNSDGTEKCRYTGVIYNNDYLLNIIRIVSKH